MLILNEARPEMNYIHALQKIVGENYVITDSEEKYIYEQDNTGNLRFPCDCVVKPASSQEISAILQMCSEYALQVTVRGGGTGVTGGALPLYGGIVLSLERFNRILEIDTTNSWALVESGVVTQKLSDAAKDRGLYYPIVPGSGGSCLIGGNISTGAGSHRSARYGTIRDYVINLEVVLPTGEIMWTGANTTKNSSGFNLTQLFVGSEGTLGVITRALLKLVPFPSHEIVLLSAFDSTKNAISAIEDIAMAGISPSSVELICEDALWHTAEYLKYDFPLLDLKTKAHLLVELDAYEHHELMSRAEKSTTIIEQHTDQEILVGDTTESKKKLWQLRECIGEAMTQNGLQYRDVDICVPRSQLLNYLEGVQNICRQHDLRTASFGHAWDGNLHTMILLSDEESIFPNEKVDKALEEIHHFGGELGGVISGEHGIGLLQRDLFRMLSSERKMELVRGIKKLFDPAGIINKDKIFTTI